MLRDPLGRLTNLTWRLGETTTDLEHTYYDNNLMKSRTINGATTYFNYDSASRLTKMSGAVSGGWEFTPGGDLIRSVDADGITWTHTLGGGHYPRAVARTPRAPCAGPGLAGIDRSPQTFAPARGPPTLW